MPFRIDLSLVERAEHPADIFYIRTTTRQEEEKDGSITEKEIHEVVVDTFIHSFAGFTYYGYHLVPPSSAALRLRVSIPEVLLSRMGYDPEGSWSTSPMLSRGFDSWRTLLLPSEMFNSSLQCPERVEYPGVPVMLFPRNVCQVALAG